jgi:hypothetical protein
VGIASAVKVQGGHHHRLPFLVDGLSANVRSLGAQHLGQDHLMSAVQKELVK